MLAAQGASMSDFVEEYLARDSFDMVHERFDFLSDTAGTDDSETHRFLLNTGSDGTFGIEDVDTNNGVAILSASTGAGSSGERGSISQGLVTTGAQNPVLAVRFQLNGIATRKIEIGFTDVGTDAGAVNSLSGNTMTAANAAILVRDTEDTTLWQLVGAKAGTPPTKIEPTSAQLAAVAATTYYTAVVMVRDGDARFLMFNAAGRELYDSKFNANFITSTTAITPWICNQLRGSVDSNMSIDFIEYWWRRSSSN
jgi:hypothetical protein